MESAEKTPPEMDENAPLPVPPAKLLEILDSLDISYKIYDHDPIFTVEQGAHLKAQIPGMHCRNLFLRDKKKIMYLVVAANETAIDMKKLEKIIDSGRLSFGSADRLWTHLGIRPGSVCPFTVMNDKDHQVNVILDAFMMRAETVNYHPMDNAQTISLVPADLLKFFDFTGHRPRIVDLTAAAPDPT
jgi:Ala-tRNA(Pro) deacylase